MSDVYVMTDADRGRLPVRVADKDVAPPEPTPDVRRSKLRFDLISPLAELEVARAMTIGALKHGDTNYLDHPREDEEEQQMASLMRHLNADRRGEAVDADGFFHLAAVAARAQMLIHLRICRATVASPASDPA